jgi:hypothetical protein
MMRQTIQKHFYLLLSVALVLALCFLVGFGLMKVSAASTLPDVINTHQPYLLAWRMLVYATVVVYWPGLVYAIVLKRDTTTAPPLPGKIYRRKTVILVCLAFEFLIVQNIVGILLAYVF